MDEERLLQGIEARSRDLSRFDQVLVGPGDDCAEVFIGDGVRDGVRDGGGGGVGGVGGGGGGRVLACVDQVVEGRHVAGLVSGEAIPDGWLDAAARKVVARSVSDIDAMAGRAVASLATGAIPGGVEWDDERCESLFVRLKHWAGAFGCPLVGGDISRTDGVLVLTCTVLGRVHDRRGSVLRSTLRAGDAVWVSGALGGAWWDEGGKGGDGVTREPGGLGGIGGLGGVGWRLADALGSGLTAAMDLSDGLGVDGARMGRASGVDIRVELDRIPIRAEALVGGRTTLDAIGDGEDYELLFGVDASIDDETVIGAVAGARRIGVAMTPGADGGGGGGRVIGVVGDGGEAGGVGGVMDISGLGWVHRGG